MQLDKTHIWTNKINKKKKKKKDTQTGLDIRHTCINNQPDKGQTYVYYSLVTLRVQLLVLLAIRGFVFLIVYQYQHST